MSYEISGKTLKDGTLVRNIKFGKNKLSVRINVVWRGELTADYSDFLIALKNFQDVNEDKFSTDDEKMEAVGEFSYSIREVIGNYQYKKIKKFFVDNGEVLTESDLGKILAGGEQELPKE